MENTDSDRLYSFNCVTYGDFENVKRILRSHDLVYCWAIEHDSDVDEHGNPEGNHIHFVIRTKNAHTFSAIRKWFKNHYDGEKPATVRVEACDSERGSVRYLCHLDNPEKYAYDMSKLFCLNNRSRNLLEDYFSDNGGDDRQFTVIMEYATYQISLQEAIKRAPEIFIHKYSSISRLIIDLRREFDEKKFDEKEKEND